MGNRWGGGRASAEEAPTSFEREAGGAQAGPVAKRQRLDRQPGEERQSLIMPPSPLAERQSQSRPCPSWQSHLGRTLPSAEPPGLDRQHASCAEPLGLIRQPPPGPQARAKAPAETRVPKPDLLAGGVVLMACGQATIVEPAELRKAGGSYYIQRQSPGEPGALDSSALAVRCAGQAITAAEGPGGSWDAASTSVPTGSTICEWHGRVAGPCEGQATITGLREGQATMADPLVRPEVAWGPAGQATMAEPLLRSEDVRGPAGQATITEPLLWPEVEVRWTGGGTADSSGGGMGGSSGGGTSGSSGGGAGGSSAGGTEVGREGGLEGTRECLWRVKMRDCVDAAPLVLYQVRHRWVSALWC